MSDKQIHGRHFPKACLFATPLRESIPMTLHHPDGALELLGKVQLQINRTIEVTHAPLNLRPRLPCGCVSTGLSWDRLFLFARTI
jgi:hypothetical protein